MVGPDPTRAKIGLARAKKKKPILGVGNWTRKMD